MSEQIKDMEEKLNGLQPKESWESHEELYEGYERLWDKTETIARTAIKLLYDLQQQIEDLKNKYYDLIMTVSEKYPNETRHQTARRYILEAEKSTD